MVGFLELFLLWLGLAIWAGILGRQPGAPRQVGAIAWVTGACLGLAIVLGAYGLVSMLGAAEPTEAAGRALQWAMYAAHGVLILGYLALLGATGAWWMSRER